MSALCSKNTVWRSRGQTRSPFEHGRATESGKVLIVDPDRADVSEISSMLEREGYAVVTQPDGRDILGLSNDEHPDVILLDVALPGSCGYELCATLKRNASTRMIPVVLITASQRRDDRTRGLEAGADDFFSRPVRVDELRARLRSLVRLKRFTDDLESAHDIIRSLAMTIEARDAVTGGHCQRLAQYATVLGSALDLGEDELQILHDGGFLHDIGKVAIPDMILLKPARLSPIEREQMKRHTLIGDALCGRFRSLARVRDIVRHHHERLDGSGYPDGLKGEEIPFLAQVINLVDTFDALTTVRPYKTALARENACDELMAEVRRGWRRRDLTTEFIALERSGQLATRTDAYTALSDQGWNSLDLARQEDSASA
jgi:putative two-component system response regulator